jgi:hypothetical protein
VSAKYNLVCDQATTFDFQFQILNDNTPWDLTNYDVVMTVRPFVGASTTTVVATNDNGRISIDGPNGRITVTIDAVTTGNIVASRYAYDLVVDSGSVITRILEGKFVVTGAVTI